MLAVALPARSPHTLPQTAEPDVPLRAGAAHWLLPPRRDGVTSGGRRESVSSGCRCAVTSFPAYAAQGWERGWSHGSGLRGRRAEEQGRARPFPPPGAPPLPFLPAVRRQRLGAGIAGSWIFQDTLNKSFSSSTTRGFMANFVTASLWWETGISKPIALFWQHVVHISELSSP